MFINERRYPWATFSDTLRDWTFPQGASKSSIPADFLGQMSEQYI